MNSKLAERRHRRGSWYVLALASVQLVLAPVACRDEEQRAAAPGEPPAKEALKRVGRYAMGAGTLYRYRGGDLEAVGALPGVGVARDTIAGCGASAPGLVQVQFRRLRLAPDSALAAWATAGPGSCVGLLRLDEPPVVVLGYWSTATTDSLLWAPVGKYLAVWLVHQGRRRSLWLYDAVRGAQLEMPWEADCRLAGHCDVEQVDWLGGSLLNVRIRLGPAEDSVPFEVNVDATASLDSRGEM